MMKILQPRKAAVCSHCSRECRLTDGAEIYRNRHDLWSLNFWICDTCDAYVGCHKPGDNCRGSNANGTLPLGTAANKELRILRHKIHRLVDPFWEKSNNKRGHRQELYAHLTHFGHHKKLIHDGETFHVSTLTLESAQRFYDLFDEFARIYYPYGVRVISRVK